jgi:hypothetical protein
MILADVKDSRRNTRRNFVDAIMYKRLGSLVEFVDTVFTSDPQRSVPVFQQRDYVRTAQAVPLGGIVYEHFEVISIVAV